MNKEEKLDYLIYVLISLIIFQSNRIDDYKVN